MPQAQVYLDDNGDPLPDEAVYLDDSGEPIHKTTVVSPRPAQTLSNVNLGTLAKSPERLPITSSSASKITAPEPPLRVETLDKTDLGGGINLGTRSNRYASDEVLAKQIIPYKGGLVSGLYLKNNPDRIPGIGRTDERFFDSDKLPKALQWVTDRIALSKYGDYLPEDMKTRLIWDTTFAGSLLLNLVDMVNDPTAPVVGAIGMLRKSIGAKELARLAEEAAAIVTPEVRIQLTKQAQKVGTPQYNTSQFGLSPSTEALPYPQNVVPNRLRAPGTNATVFDALVPERLKYNEMGAATRATTEVVPPVVEEKLQEPGVTFNGRTLEDIEKLPSGQPPKPFQPRGLRLQDAAPAIPGTFGHLMPGIVDNKGTGFHTIDDLSKMASGRGEVTLYHGTTGANAASILENGVNLPQSGEAAAKIVADKYGIPWSEWKAYVEPQTLGSGYGNQPSRLSTAPGPVADRWANNFPQGEIYSDLNAKARMWKAAKAQGRARDFDAFYDEIAERQAATGGSQSIYDMPNHAGPGSTDLMANSGKPGQVLAITVDARALPKNAAAEARSLMERVQAGKMTEEEALEAWNMNYKDIKIAPQNIRNVKPIERLQEIAESASEEKLPTPGTGGMFSNFLSDEDMSASAVPRPRRTGNVDVETLDNPIAKLIVKLRQARPLNKAQAELYRIERGKRAGGIATAEGEGWDWLKNAKASMKGSYEKVKFEPLDLNDDDASTLMGIIRADDELDDFAKLRAGNALQKISEGKVPQPGEVRTLSSIFTNRLTRDLNDPQAAGEVTSELLSSLFKKQSKATQFNQNFVSGLQRSMMTMWDISAPFRQGLGAVTNKEWWTSWDDMIKAFGSENAAREIQLSIKTNPNYKLKTQSGLALSDIATPKGLTEEGFGTPLWAKKYMPGLNRSERAYNAFMSKTRSDLFDSVWEKALQAGMKPGEEMETAKGISRMINNITGRGDLGSLEESVDHLNKVFFSPRLMASRAQFFNYKNYINQPAYIRNQMLRSAAGMAAAAAAFNIGGSAAGGSLESDPRSSDFGKIRFGPTRIDPGGGWLQHMTLLARYFAMVQPTKQLFDYGYKTTEREGHPAKEKQAGGKFADPNFRDVFYRFLENKASPGAALLIKAWEGYDPQGKPFDMPAEMIKNYVPLMAQDMLNIMVQDGDMSREEVTALLQGKNPFRMPRDKREMLAFPTTLVGMGAQTYK